MKPILIFPKPSVILRKKVKLPIPQAITPSHKRQALRLNKTFKLLESNFKNGALSGDPAGFAPERTLVLETIGSVEKFYRAASKIPGLEFVQEILGEEIDPTDNFYLVDKHGDKSDKKLKGYVYLTMANQEALNKLLTYWNGYTKQKYYKFPWGLAPLKYLFEHLQSIRYWDTEDRLRETGLIEDWRYRVSEGQDIVPVEIELWYRVNTNARNEAESRVLRQINKLKGQILQTCIIDEIHYHAILANLPVNTISQLLDGSHDNIELLRCDEVMYFRPTGHCMAPIFTSDKNDTEVREGAIQSENTTEINENPTVALLDGLPLENHEWIRDFIYIDDPDGFSEDYSPADQRHGTSMASLIIRGDMQAESTPIPRKLYCRPILKPSVPDFQGYRRERIPEGILPIDIIHRAVKRLFDSDGGEPPVAPTIKIINLSIADPSRLFDQQMSPWAKLIDYFSEKYQVLFVISAGNHLFDIELDITNKEFLELPDDDKELRVLRGIVDSTHSRRLMSPAESINAITVAAYHHDDCDGDEFYGTHNPYKDKTMPSTINPITWGKKRSVKPEILMPGGRATYRLKSVLDNALAVLEVVTYEGPPGHKVASPGRPGSLKAFSHTFGTSNSTALASRRLCFLNETIQDLYSAQHGNELSSEYENVLLKSLLCHGASHPQSVDKIEALIKESNNSKRFKSIIAKYLGYGVLNEERIHGCTDNQATILQCGKIKQDGKHVYKFRLPDSLNAQFVRRRLIITLSWLSPINANNYTYRQAALFFEPAARNSDENYLDMQSRELDWQMVRKGTVQHEVLTGDRASVYASGTNLEIAVQCKGQAGAKDISIPYGLVVTLDTPGVVLPIYEEVKAGIEAQFQAQIEPEETIKI